MDSLVDAVCVVILGKWHCHMNHSTLLEIAKMQAAIYTILVKSEKRHC